MSNCITASLIHSPCSNASIQFTMKCVTMLCSAVAMQDLNWLVTGLNNNSDHGGCGFYSTVSFWDKGHWTC